MKYIRFDGVLYRGGFLVALADRTIPSGQALLAEFIQYGHQKPFEEIVRRYAGMVFNVCYRITKDKHEAEDATQAVFLTLALQAKRGTDIKALGPWLQQVAKRLALDTRRSKKRRHTREERHHTETTNRREALLDEALPSADLDELKTILHEELQKLPAKYRLPLILHYFGGLTRDEMAAELNCKPSTLGVRIFRGREMLAGRLSSRGINISTAMLATLMGLYVKHAVSETLIASTSHAATAMLAGHDGAGMASAHVIGLTRRATGALVIGKVKVAAITLMLAGTSLGAGAKALGMLPQIDVQRILSNQLQRLVAPLLQPFNHPFRVDAKTQSTPVTVAIASPAPVAPMVDLTQLIATVNPPVKVIARTSAAKESSTGDSGGIAINFSPGPSRSAWTESFASGYRTTESTPMIATGTADRATPAAVVAAVDDPDSSTSSASAGGAGGGGGGGAGIASDYHLAASLPSRSTSENATRSPDVTISVNDLVVGSASLSSLGRSSGLTSTSSPAASPASLIEIPAVGGTVTQSSKGEVKGYGIVDRTGNLQNNGLVVADGQGVDRTLNLSSFSSVQTAMSPVTATDAAASTSAPVACNASSGSTSTATLPERKQGWYAINHGRLTLPLQAAPNNPSVLTWGDNPAAPALSLVNSVRLALTTDGSSAANTVDPTRTKLSLLASDRSDAPSLFQITGATIGLWQVDHGQDDIPSANLTVCYDSVLADDLGASPSSVQLWTYGTSDSWQPVSASSFSLDTAENLVSGSASDFSYFAVSVDPTAGHDLQDLSASELVEVSTPTSSTIQAVPEPIALPLLIAGAALLGRRRRSATADNSLKD